MNTSISLNFLTHHYSDLKQNSGFFFFSVALSLLGILLNLVKACVFSRKALNKKTYIGHMHALLSIFNIISLAIPVLFEDILPYFSIYPSENSNFLCKTLNFLPTFSTTLLVHSCVCVGMLVYANIVQKPDLCRKLYIYNHAPPGGPRPPPLPRT